MASQIPRRSFEPPPLPPGKPPPRPLDFPSDFSRLEFSPTASELLSIPYPIRVHICGKVDAAGDDPGDTRFHQILASWEFVSDFMHSLEDKACLKRSARAVGSQVECESFTLPPPAQPPPLSRTDLVSFLLIFNNTVDCNSSQLSGRREASGDDPGDILFLQFPVASGFAFNYSLEDKAGLMGSARVVITLREGSYVEGWSFMPPPPAEPPPEPPSDRVCVLFAFIGTNSTAFMSLQLTGRKEASGIDPGDKPSPFRETKVHIS